MQRRKTSVQYAFRPRLMPSIALILLLPSLVMLGFWQLSRAEQKRQLQTSYQQRSQLSPLSAKALNPQKDLQFYPVTLQGTFDNQHQLLLDNQISNGHVGYQVITPFQIRGQRETILVNRGWIAAGPNRQQLPQLTKVQGVQTVRGILRRPKQRLLLQKTTVKPSQWPWRVQSINTEIVSKVLHQHLFPMMVLLSPKAPHGFVREWAPVKLNANKSVGYAFQWFAMALTLLIIYLLLTIKRRKIQ